MKEYIRVRKDEYEKLLYFKRRYDEQNKIHHEVVKEMQEDIDQLERNCDFFNEQMNDAVERTVELNKEKQELKEWLEEEIKNPNNMYQMFDLLNPRESLDGLVNLKLKKVLERLG